MMDQLHVTMELWRVKVGNDNLQHRMNKLLFYHFDTEFEFFNPSQYCLELLIINFIRLDSALQSN